MNFLNVYNTFGARDVLYQLLSERETHQSISHKAMPTYEQHCAFLASNPYKCWYLIDVDGLSVGAIYLTKQDEIGIGILKAHRRKGRAQAAIRKLVAEHPGRFLANVAPGNTESRTLFTSLGFKLIQMTYELC